MTLKEKILSIYPEIQFSAPVNYPVDDYCDIYIDYIVMRNDSDGRGDYIAVWNHPTLAQPTQEQLDAVGEG